MAGSISDVASETGSHEEGAVETLEAGREAISRHAWTEALEALTEAEKSGPLAPDDLMMLGDAYWWTAQPDEAVAAFERAFQAFMDEERRSEAAVAGALLGYMAMRRLAMSVAHAWVTRVTKLLEGQPESVGHGWLKIMEVADALFGRGDVEAVVVLSDEAIEIAKRQGVVGIQAMAMSFKGVAKVYQGQWKEGIALIDEATVVAMTSRGDLRVTSDVYCNTIGACSSLADYRRASEWTDQAERWMRANAVGGFTGVCQVHRAELKRLRGSWSDAEETARVACDELERFHLLNGIGFAHYEIGEVRRRMGDLHAAEEAFTTAYQYGHPAQPGYSLLLLDRREKEEAAKSIAAALANTTPGGLATSDVLSRAHLLPAQVEIAISVGDLNSAREAIEELEEVAEVFDSPTWRAMALSCRGSLDLSEHHPDRAERALGQAWRLWQEIELPYEMARAREMLSRAKAELGDETGSKMELKAARAVYQQLGARLDLERVEDMLDPGRRERAQGARTVKSMMFTDIVTSTDLIGIIGDEAWERLLGWHDRALREEFAEHGGQEVRHTGDGFFVTFDTASDAVECAVAIQRRLVDHRVEHGFSPSVRIGIHTAEALALGGDYSGQGVHTAARIGDLAHSEEILISRALLEQAGAIPYQVSEPKEVQLKGVAEPLEVQSVNWRR